MSEYTPTPWEVYTVKDQYPGIEALNGTFSIVVWGDSKIESDCGVQGRTPEEANAEFIVRAVNSHEALVEALKRMIVHAKLTLHPRAALGQDMDFARAALELAGG